jgi:hypothetical protein
MYVSIGQYLVYAALLEELKDTTPLYLAIPEHAYAEYFDRVIQRVIQNHHIRLIIVNLDKEEIVRWIE